MAAGTTRYDADTGQVFAETVVPQDSRCRCRGGRYEYPSPDALKVRPARFLKQMALHAAARNVAFLTREALEAVPVHLLAELCDVLLRQDRDSLTFWQMVVSIAPQENQNLRNYQGSYSFYCDCRTPELPKVLSVAAELPSVYQVRLMLAHPSLCVDDYMAVADCPNITSILVDQPSPEDQPYGSSAIFDMRILRSWAMAARERGAFSRLETLTLRDNLVDSHVFSIVNAFPCLRLLQIHNVALKDKYREADRFGWNLISRYRRTWGWLTVNLALDMMSISGSFQTNVLNLDFDGLNRSDPSQRFQCLLFERDFARSQAYNLPTSTLDTGMAANVANAPRIKKRKARDLDGLLDGF